MPDGMHAVHERYEVVDLEEEGVESGGEGLVRVG